jgi:hypothetical protein
MADTKKDRAEVYRAFLEADEDALRIILRHRGHTLFLSARPEAAVTGQVVQLLSAVAETQQGSASPCDMVWHADSLFQQIRNAL